MSENLVAVLVATFRRPAGLARLLAALQREADEAPFSVEIVVVDNDPDATAGRIVDQAATGWDGAIRYVVQPTPGIAAARNALLDASTEADLVAFIDDDEVPEPGWLRSLVDTAERLGADVVTGPVLYDFETAPSALVRAAPCFRVRRLITGDLDVWPRTGNVLLRTATLRVAAARFPEAYGVGGGSDTAFFAALEARGARAIWCDEAVVSEAVPPERSSLRYVLRRGLRVGNTTALVDREFGSTLRWLVVRPVKMIGNAVRGLVWVGLGGLSRDPSRLSVGLYELARSLGMALGLAGRQVIGYRRAPAVSPPAASGTAPPPP